MGIVFTEGCPGEGFEAGGAGADLSVDFTGGVSAEGLDGAGLSG